MLGGIKLSVYFHDTHWICLHFANQDSFDNYRWYTFCFSVLHFSWTSVITIWSCPSELWPLVHCDPGRLQSSWKCGDWYRRFVFTILDEILHLDGSFCRYSRFSEPSVRSEKQKKLGFASIGLYNFLVRGRDGSTFPDIIFVYFLWGLSSLAGRESDFSTAIMQWYLDRNW